MKATVGFHAPLFRIRLSGLPNLFAVRCNERRSSCDFPCPACAVGQFTLQIGKVGNIRIATCDCSGVQHWHPLGNILKMWPMRVQADMVHCG
jgi:hypothetical protein